MKIEDKLKAIQEAGYEFNCISIDLDGIKTGFFDQEILYDVIRQNIIQAAANLAEEAHELLSVEYRNYFLTAIAHWVLMMARRERT